MPALTQVEALARFAHLTVHAYFVDLDLSAAKDCETFGSTARITFHANASGPTWVEIKADALDDVRLDGVPVDVAPWSDGRLPLDLAEGDHELVVAGRYRYSRTGEGLHRYTDPQDGEVYLYSQAFLDDAPRLYGCFDQPDLKATFTLAVTAPPDWMVLGNGSGTRTAPGRWEFATTRPISTYLFAVVAGPYQGVREHHDGIEIGVWSRKSWRPHLDTERLLRTTRQGFDYFHQLFDVRYPFGKYDQVFVPEFNAGAMENPGLVTFRDEHYLQRGTVTAYNREEVASTQLHEMAHMWFGDLVTMKWWNDLWLNESFAEYLAHRSNAEATEHTGAWTTFLAKRKSWGYLADQMSTTHPIAGPAADTEAALLNFDGISYAKGASALRQLVAWVGDEAFLTALRQHFADHAFGNASLADLVSALTTASGRDVAGWAELWLRTSGVATLGVDVESTDGVYTAAGVHQDAPDVPRPHRFAVGLYDVVDQRLARRCAVDVELPAAAVHPVPGLVGQPVADLVLPNDGDLTFALLDLDDGSLATVRDHLRTLDDPLARAVIWIGLTEMVPAGRFSPAALVDLVTGHLTTADPEAVTIQVLGAAVTAADLWATGAQRTGLLGRLATWLSSELGAVAPGGDRQLALARALTHVDPDPARLRDWLSGAGAPAGLVVDDDLRWRLLHRLATLGAIGPDEIDAAHGLDPSTAGSTSALRARAALPTAAAKEWAWGGAVAGRFSNHELTAVGEGFWSADQPDLLAPYVGRFAADYPRVSAGQATELTMLWGQLLFPRTAVDAATVAMAETLLAGGGLSPIARRMVAEGRDKVQRGLRARSL